MQNTKLLVIFVFLIITSGIGLLFSRSNSPAPTTLSDQPESTASAQIEGDRVLVTKVVDGDTIRVEMAGKKYTVRILGVDTPETVDPRKPVQCFGKEASNEIKNLLEGQRVILQKDISDKDKYDRLLRYVFLPLEGGQTLFVDDYLIREGFAHVLTIPPDVKYAEQFLEAQREARAAKKGLWGRC